MSQVDELRIVIAKKDEEIIDCRKAIDRLQTSVQQLTSQLENANMDIAKMSKLQNKIDELSSSLLTFKWWIPYQKLKASEQNSEPFCSALIPYFFQMTADLTKGALKFFLHRYRGLSEQFHGKVNMNLSGFSFEIYIIGRDGNKISQETTFDGEDRAFEIDAGKNGSLGLGWISVASVAPKWLVNDHVHVFCKIKQN